jgi:hypothetical protein
MEGWIHQLLLLLLLLLLRLCSYSFSILLSCFNSPLQQMTTTKAPAKGTDAERAIHQKKVCVCERERKVFEYIEKHG